MVKNKNKNRKLHISKLHEHDSKRKSTQKIVFLGVIFMFILASFFAFQNVSQYHASIIPISPVPAFNGTTYPVKQVPNWAKLTSAEYKAQYSSIPSSKLISLPKYDTNILSDRTSKNELYTNTRITYPVVYLGNYKFDGTEYVGSHLAVDIKIPTGTPIYAIANGFVSKTENLSGGFGNHIVVTHENVPNPANPSQKTTLYSSYGHLSAINVTEGQVVLKGQQIGLSGDSGLASAPHLHFQIDNDNAPWHPYWPFTYKDMSDAGIKSFNDAIDLGLGRSNAELMSVSPMAYVQNNMIGTAVFDINSSQNTQNIVPQNQPVNTNANINTTVDSGTVVGNSSNLSIKITSKTSYKTNEGIVFKITVYEGDTEFAGNFDGAIKVSLNGSGIGILDKTTLISSDFRSSAANITLINPQAGNGSITVEFNGKKYTSQDFQIVSVGSPNSIVVFNDQIRNSLQGSLLFADISASFPNYQAIQYLKNKNIIAGYSDGTFKPEQVVSRAEALKFIMEATNTPTKSSSSIPFLDVKTSDWFINYVMTGYINNIVQGYSFDHTFKPNNTVSKVEFLKMLLATLKIETNPVSTSVYSDVAAGDWFAPYVSYAKDKNIVEVIGNNFNPNDGMKRKDVAEVIYRVMVIKETNAVRYSDGLASAQ